MKVSDIGRRPRCFGVGLDLDSRQRVPLDRCQECPVVELCARLRVARCLEGDIADLLARILGALAPYGRPDDRWGRR